MLWRYQRRLFKHVCCGAVSLEAMRNASAAIVYSGEQNIAITQNFNGVFINVPDFQNGSSSNFT